MRVLETLFFINKTIKNLKEKMSTLTGNDVMRLMEAYQAVYAPQELTEEQVWEEVENWVNTLIEEGYDLSDYTWEEMFEAYLEEQGRPGSAAIRNQNVYKPPTPSASASRPAGGGMGGMRGSGRDRNATQTSSSPGALRVNSTAPAPAARPAAPAPAARPAAPAPAARPAAPAPAKPAGTTPTAKPSPAPSASPARPSLSSQASELRQMRARSLERQGKPLSAAVVSATAKPTAYQANSFDPFDVIKGHLLDEGYADTEEAALVIMANMSEEWRESIVEAEDARNNPEKYEIRQRQSETGGQRTERKVRDRLSTMDPEKRKKMIAQMRAVGLNV
jgi:hypothetical protein